METAAPSSSLSSFAPVHLINFCVVHTNLSFQSRPAILHLHPSCPQDFSVPPLVFINWWRNWGYQPSLFLEQEQAGVPFTFSDGKAS